MLNNKAAHIIILSFALLLTMCSCVPKTAEDSSKAVRGYLDLNEWDFNRQGPARLDGEWEFYANTSYSAVQQTTPAQKDYFPLPSLWKGTTSRGLFFKIKAADCTGYGSSSIRIRLTILYLYMFQEPSPYALSGSTAIKSNRQELQVQIHRLKNL